MKKLPGIVLCIILLAPAYLFAGLELPAFSKSDQIIRHTMFTLCYLDQYEQAEWTAYVLTSMMVTARGVRRSNDFRPDPLVMTGTATPEDYRKSGYDKGHLVPANDMKSSGRSMSETFYLSNMSPQVPAFNRGIWKRLEEQVRRWAEENEEICVVTGPVLTDDGFAVIGPNRVAVPLRYYKVILDYREPGLKAIGFIIPNCRSDADLETYAVTIDAVEEITGIDFFPELPSPVEEQLESVIELEKWFH